MFHLQPADKDVEGGGGMLRGRGTGELNQGWLEVGNEDRGAGEWVL